MYEGTAQFYDFFDSDRDEPTKRATFVSGFLSGNPGVVIDVGSGTGEIAFQLAKHGHHIHCFEPSPAMYSVLLDRLNKRNDLHQQISVFPCKVEELESSLKADLAIASSVFSHLSREDRKTLLNGLFRQLKPDGILIFNCVQYAAGRLNKPWTQIGEKVIGNIIYRHFGSSEQLDLKTRRVSWKFEVKTEGRLIREYNEDFFLNMDSIESVRDMIEKSGFRKLEFFGSYDGHAVDADKPNFVVIARRST